MKKLITNIAEDLINKNPEKYEKKWRDYGYINNGVGMTSCGGEYEYDETKAQLDAKEMLLDNLDIWAGKKKGMPDEFFEKIFECEDVYNFIKNKITQA